MLNFNFRTIRPWFILLLFLGLWIVIPTAIKSFSHKAFYEFQAPIWVLTSQLKDLQSYWGLKNHPKKDLIEVSRDLARINAAHELRLSENLALREELARLEKILDLEKNLDFDYSIARVVKRSINAWSHQLVIRKGRADGIPQGAAVVYGKGVVGRIKDVGHHTSIVELVSSPTFRIAARFSGDNRPITYRGLENPAFSKPKGLVYNVPTDISVSPSAPLQLVSSRLGGVFPDGLTIGKLSHIEPGADGLFNQGRIDLHADIHSLHEVAVLIPQSQEYDYAH